MPNKVVKYTPAAKATCAGRTKLTLGRPLPKRYISEFRIGKSDGRG